MYFDYETLKDLMDATPFRPFRITLTNGRQYEVPHHDAAFITENKFEIGIDLNKKGVGRRSINCAFAHIASIEDVTESVK